MKMLELFLRGSETVTTTKESSISCVHSQLVCVLTRVTVFVFCEKESQRQELWVLSRLL